MHCGVMVTGYNQGDWDRLMKGEYDRPPDVSDAQNMDNTLYMGELVEPLGFDSIWATEHYGLPTRCSRIHCNTWLIGRGAPAALMWVPQ